MGKQAQFLEAAFAIGARFCRDALWWEDRCNWLGDCLHQLRAGRQKLKTSTLGSDVYGGTAGVGLFLAHVASVTGDAIIAKAARGAGRHAARRMLKGTDTEATGFYNGAAGVGVALIEMGRVLGDEELTAKGRSVLLKMIGGSSPEQTDIMAGAAGTLVAFNSLPKEERSEELDRFERQLVDQLLRSAARSDRGWSWRTTSDGQHPNLCGFSHGVAGIVWALANWNEKHDDQEVREAIDEGVRYEQSWYQTKQRNWPDLRKESGSAEDPATPCMTAWCHGAPGIALARLKMARMLELPELNREGLDAIETTVEFLQRFLDSGAGNFSLCHGVAGNADILLWAADFLNREDYRRTATTVGELGLESYGDERRSWPCGFSAEGYTPALMLGHAGTGMFYLRLYDSKRTPSVLCPDEFVSSERIDDPT